MTTRRVTATATNAHGYVTQLINPDEPWSPRAAGEAILDIELGQFSYFVSWPDRRTQVLALDDAGGTYLFTQHGDADHNGLLELAG